MKHPISIYLQLLLLALLQSPVAAVVSAELEPYRDGKDLNFSLPDLEDRTHTLADYHGKVILVNFWASWCPPCIYEMPELRQLRLKLKGKPFDVIAINVGEKKHRVRKFTDVTNFNLPTLLDTANKAMTEWDVKTLPTSFLIDAEGHTRYRIRGNPGWVEEHTVSLIEKLITESSIDSTESTNP